MNVLLTCAGRRVYLIAAFQRALSGRGKVYAADHNPHAATLQEADAALALPAFETTGYVDALLALCLEHDIGLLVSLNDFELRVLAPETHRFLDAGIVPVVSSAAVVDTCLDKLKMHDFVADVGLPTPPTFSSLPDALEGLRSHSVAFPLVVKPRWGTASVGLHVTHDEPELELAYGLVRWQVTRGMLEGISGTDPEHSVLIQQFCAGLEHGVDVVNDLRGRHVCTFARRKLLMRAGETDQAITVTDARLGLLGERVGNSLGHVGVLDCDVIVHGDDCYLIDMNPRFGGGYPYSHIAGADVPAALLAWACGQEPEERWLTVNPGVVVSKTDRFVVFSRHPDHEPYGGDPMSARISG